MTVNSKGGKTNSTAGQNQVLPIYSERRALSVSTDVLFPTRDKITDDDIERIITRDEMAWVILERRADDLFNKWFEIEADEDVRISIEEFNLRLKLRSVFKLWYKMKKSFGLALLFLGYNDTKENILEPVSRVRKLAYVIPFPKKAITKYFKFTDIASEKWGQIEKYELQLIIDDKEEKMIIPSSRFIHWRNEGIDNDPTGTSMFLPMYNSFLLKFNMDYAVYEGLWKSAAGLWVLNYPDGVTPSEKSDAEDGFNNMDVKTEMRLPFGYKVDIKDTSKAMNPAAHINYMKTKIGVGSRMGKTSLEGAQAGAVTGAEWNFKQYYAFISDEQVNDAEPIIRELYDRMMEFNIIKKGEYKIIWNSPFERSPEEIAKINDLNADFVHKLSDALVKLNTTNHQIAIEENGKVYIRIDDTDQGILLEGIQTATLTSKVRESTPEPAPQLPFQTSQNYVNIDPEERLKALKAWEPSLDKNIPEFTAELQKVISDYEKNWLKRFEVIWNQSGMAQNYSQKLKRMIVAKNDVKDLIKALEKVAPSDKKIQKTLYDYMKTAYETGWEDTAIALGISYDFPIDQPLVEDWLIAQAPMLKDDITTELNNKLLRGIRDGLSAGEGYEQIARRLHLSIAGFNKNITATVHKYVAKAQQTARADQLKKEGDKEVLWLTVGDDRVRPEHTSLEHASPHNIDDVRQYFGDWGCRCSIAPFSILEKFRREGEI